MRISVATRAEATEKLREQINAMRNRLEQSPITRADGTTWDYDRDARERIQRSIEQWDELGDIKTAAGLLPWSLADNTVQLVSLPDLQAAKSELDALLAARGARLHAHAYKLKAQAPFVADGWDDVASWPG